MGQLDTFFQKYASTAERFSLEGDYICMREIFSSGIDANYVLLVFVAVLLLSSVAVWENRRCPALTTTGTCLHLAPFLCSQLSLKRRSAAEKYGYFFLVVCGNVCSVMLY